MTELIEPIEKEIDGRIYVLSKFPSVTGREIIAKYPVANTPKIGDYGVSEETMLKLMKYVCVVTADGSRLPLSNVSLINNHTQSWETIIKLEGYMLEYNCSFLNDGRASNFLETIAQKLPQWISKILTDSLERLSQTGKPPSTN